MAEQGGGEVKTIAIGAGDTQEKSGEETTAALPKLPKKQACKRPAEDQQLQNAAAAKKRAQHSNRQRAGAPAPPPQGYDMQAPTRTPEYYARPPLPRPPVARNNGPAPQPALNGQVRVPRQPAAYNGQVPMMTRQPAAYNGQVPMMTRQPAAHDGQMPVAHQQVAFNGQMRPPYPPAGNPSNHAQNQTVMAPPSCPAGQGVNPPSAVPRMQKQPETDEMREKRVIQQNLEEYLRLQRQIYAAKQQWRMTFMQQPQQAMAFAQQQQQQQAQAMAFTQQQQQQQAQAMAFTQQQQQQAQAMAFTQQQQQAMAFTQQQQQAMAFTQQQQQQAMAFTQEEQQQQATAFARQQQQPTAYAPQLQQYRQQQQQQYHQQQPFLGGANANYHHQAGGMVPRFSLDDFYASNAAQHYERSRLVLPAASGSLGEAARVTAEALPVSTVVSVEGDGDRGSHDHQEPARASEEGDHGSQHP